MITKTQLYLFSKIPEHFRQRIVIRSNGCWLWQGEINRNGYGRCWFEGGRYMIHKWVWKLMGRPLENKQVLDHGCSTRNCCNPTHISNVTQRHNVHRGKARLYR
jgi:hypothetical protein